MKPAGDKALFAKPLQKTADRSYIIKKLVLGEEPLFFENSNKEDDKKRVLYMRYPILYL